MLCLCVSFFFLEFLSWKVRSEAGSNPVNRGRAASTRVKHFLTITCQLELEPHYFKQKWECDLLLVNLLLLKNLNVSSRAHNPQADKIPAHLQHLLSPIHLLLIPPLTSALGSVHVSCKKAEKSVLALESSTPPSAFSQQSWIKVPRVGYAPGVAVMERQYSLTSSAIVFPINLGKNNLSTFWLWSCTT